MAVFDEIKTGLEQAIAYKKDKLQVKAIVIYQDKKNDSVTHGAPGEADYQPCLKGEPYER